MTRILILIIVLIVSQCSNKKETANNRNICCNESFNKSSDFLFQYSTDSNEVFLDSALFYTDYSLEKCDSNIELLSLRKLIILSIKKNYDEALAFIDGFDEEVLSALPYYQYLLKCRFTAMKYGAKNNIHMRDNYIWRGVEEIGSFLALNSEEVDSLIVLPNIEAILDSKFSTAVVQLFYYRSVVEGKQPIFCELDSIVKSGGNEDFVVFIKQNIEVDFMSFSGI